jgi:predicted regulator of Ras-like GTPase activity (Roadblock/LC7/MglB family)
VAVTAMAMLSLNDLTVSEMEMSTLEQIAGYVNLMSDSQDAFLTALARVRARLGLKFCELHRATEALIKHL